jgi:hypothetical protein
MNLPLYLPIPAKLMTLKMSGSASQNDKAELLQ